MASVLLPKRSNLNLPRRPVGENRGEKPQYETCFQNAGVREAREDRRKEEDGGSSRKAQSGPAPGLQGLQWKTGEGQINF